MIKKLPVKLVGYRPKTIKLKAMTTPKRSFKDINLEAEQAAKFKFNETFDPDTMTYQSTKIESIKGKAAEDIASRTGAKKWGTLITKGLKRESIFGRSTPIIKKKDISTQKAKSIFVQKWHKVLKTADVGAEKTRAKTALLFTGRKGLDPLKHQPKDIKFITSKKFKKGLPRDETERTMGWAPKDELTKGQKITWAKRPENIYDVVRKDKKGNIWGVNKVLVRGKKDPTTGVEYGARWKEVKIKKLKKK